MRWCAVLGACALLIGVTAADAGAVSIASQDFNSLSDAGGPSFDNLPSGSLLTNSNATNSGGAGLDFVTRYTDTIPNPDGLGPVTTTSDTSDFIGVNSFSGSNSPDVAPDGTPVASGSEHNYEFNDGDGSIGVEFESVDVTGYATVTLSLDYWINSTSYEGIDSLSVDLDDGIGSANALFLDEAALDANVSADDGSANWLSLSYDVLASGLTDFTNISLTVTVTNNSGTENIFIDNVNFEGTLIPEPTSFALAALSMLGLFGATRRRNRS